MPFERSDPVPGGPVSKHRLLVETGTEEKNTINRLWRELQLDDGTTVSRTHDRNLSHKIDTSLWAGGCLDDVSVFCARARESMSPRARATGKLRRPLSWVGALRCHPEPCCVDGAESFGNFAYLRSPWPCTGRGQVFGKHH